MANTAINTDPIYKHQLRPTTLRLLHDMGNSFKHMAAAVGGRPIPPAIPYRKSYSGLTARQYRAGRRAYHRDMQEYTKAMKAWRAAGSPSPWGGLADSIRGMGRAS